MRRCGVDTGSSDPDYNRPMFRTIPPVTRNLLIACTVIFLLDQLLRQQLTELFSLYPVDLQHQLPDKWRFKPWQLLTYMFLHGSVSHLLFNMLILYMFGSSLEQYWGGRRFLVFFLLGGIGAALIQLGASEYMMHNGTQAPSVIGGSGALFAVLVGYGMHFPERRVMLLIPPIPMKARTLVILFGVMQIVLAFTGWQPDTAIFTHIGGLIAGLLLVQFWLKPNPRVRR